VVVALRTNAFTWNDLLELELPVYYEVVRQLVAEQRAAKRP
jgi:hypothetical protein